MMAAGNDDIAVPAAPWPGAQMLKGRVRADAELAKMIWFQTGGKAQWFFKPEDTADLVQFVETKPAGLPVMVIGVGSNLLVRDGGVEGVVVRLGREFAQVRMDGDLIEAGAACLDVNVAQFACEQSLAGLEFLSGIPGTIGGAVAMNAGAYGSDVSQVLVAAEIVDAKGALHRLSAQELGFTYRHAGVPEGAIVTRAWFRAVSGEREAIAARMQQIADDRSASQPIRSRTGGSTFKNPDGHKAWQLIDEAGCRGLRKGGAQVSEKHCNFLINDGGATSAELEALGEEVRARVKAHSGFDLEWEIRRIGRPV